MARKKLKQTEEQKFIAFALKEVKKSLQCALEWVDKKDTTWAIVNVDRAKKLLEVVRNS